MSCSEACGIAALTAVTNLTLFSDFAVHFIAHSKPEQKTTLPLEKQLAKINLEVLQVSVSSCTQNLAQEAEKSKNSFSGWLFFMWSELLRQFFSSYENHLKFWGFFVMVRRWRRVFCYVASDTACLKCCRPLGCLSKDKSMPQVTPK